MISARLTYDLGEVDLRWRALFSNRYAPNPGTPAAFSSTPRRAAGTKAGWPSEGAPRGEVPTPDRMAAFSVPKVQPRDSH